MTMAEIVRTDYSYSFLYVFFDVVTITIRYMPIVAHRENFLE